MNNQSKTNQELVSELENLQNEIKESSINISGHQISNEDIFMVLNNFDCNLYIADSNGYLVHANNMLLENLQISKRELHQKHFLEILNLKEYKTSKNDLENAILSKSGNTCEVKSIAKDGSINLIKIAVKSIINNNKTIGHIGLFTKETSPSVVDEKMNNSNIQSGSDVNRLKEINSALNILLRQRENEKKGLEDSILKNLTRLVQPNINRLKEVDLTPSQKNIVDILETNIMNIVSPFLERLSTKCLNLTTKELRIANLIKQGKTNIEIADALEVSKNTILFHRYNMRTKLGLKNKKVNLRTYLLSFDK